MLSVPSPVAEFTSSAKSRKSTYSQSALKCLAYTLNVSLRNASCKNNPQIIHYTHSFISYSHFFFSAERAANLFSIASYSTSSWVFCGGARTEDRGGDAAVWWIRTVREASSGSRGAEVGRLDKASRSSASSVSSCSLVRVVYRMIR